MSNDNGELRAQVEKLNAEIQRLRDQNAELRAQRKEYGDILFADLDANAPTEEEVAAGMKDAIPLSQFFAEIGLTRNNGTKFA